MTSCGSKVTPVLLGTPSAGRRRSGSTRRAGAGRWCDLRGRARRAAPSRRARLQLGAHRLHRQGRGEVLRLQLHALAGEADHHGCGGRGVGEPVHRPADRLLADPRLGRHGGQLDRVGAAQERVSDGTSRSLAVHDGALLRVAGVGLPVGEGHRALRGRYVDPVGEAADGPAERVLVDRQHGVEVVTAGEAVPHPARVPAAPGAGLLDGGRDVHRQAGGAGVERAALAVRGDGDRLRGPAPRARRQPSLAGGRGEAADFTPLTVVPRGTRSLVKK